MIDRSTFVHGGLAVAAVVLAATAWLKPAGAPEEESIELISGTSDQVNDLRWSDADADIDLHRAETGLQVAITNKKPAGGSAPTSAAVSPRVGPVKTHTFPANDNARELLGHLVPFRASRDLGVASKDQLASFGLVSPSAKLTLNLGQQDQALELGDSTFGSSSTYVRAADGHVYLAKSSLFSSLKGGASGLAERTLLIAPRDRIERVVIHSGAKSREVVQRFGDERAKAFFANAAEPETRLTQTTNWLDRLLRTRMADFADDKPQGAPALTVELFDDKITIASIRIWAPGDAIAFVEATGYPGTITIPKATAETLLKDVDAVLSE